MKNVGIICEYNPFHLGHQKQIQSISQAEGPDTAIVCLMSGNFVQRGAPAIIDKSLRAAAALSSGADLVLELPVTACLSSAEGFAAEGVRILSGFCQSLCFGAETADRELLLKTARALLSESFPPLLKRRLEEGLSFPAAREQALLSMHLDTSILSSPNNILAVEYCKAIVSQSSGLEPMPIYRGGNYHDFRADAENPSATSIRALMSDGRYWRSYVPAEAGEILARGRIHTREAGSRAVLARLRTMTDEEFEALPYGSEGLWRKFMHNCRSCATPEEILEATKSKRYTRSRLDRMMMCAFLGLSKEDLQSPVPYTRVLGFTDRGRTILKQARNSGIFLNAGEEIDSPCCRQEYRVGDLYGLFAVGAPEAPGVESLRRVVYRRSPEV